MDADIVDKLNSDESDDIATSESNYVKLTDGQEESIDDTFDDNEFNIPPVEHLPTLESILNAPDEDDLRPQHNFMPELSSLTQSDCWEVASISSHDSSTTSTITPTHRKAKFQISDKHGTVFRHVKLKSISSQLISAADKVDAGLPTALAVSTYIAVGTSHGLVLVFDSKQVLRWCLGSTAVGAQYGAVSALSFNVDCTRLLCGFARGQITMWNLTNGKLLRTVVDAHPPGTAILHVKFTDDRTVAVTSDSGGSVFQLEFKRLMGVRTCDSHCLFSGSRGEACVVEPLCTQQAVSEHPMKDVAILAMASLSKVLIVVTKPHLKVHYIHPLTGDPSTLPLLSWQYVIIQVSEGNRIVDPVLAFARDQTIYFAQVVCHSVEDIKVTLLQKLDLTYKILAMTWINSRSMVFVDTSERAHLVDIKTEEEIQVLDLAEVQLVYSTSFYKSLATGGNVSRALAYAGDRACYQSVVTFNNQLVLLGTRGVHVLTLRTWSERVNALVRQNKYKQALELGLAFYKGLAKAVVELSWNPGKRRSLVNDLMRNVLLQYVDQSLTTQCPSRGKIEELKNHYQDVVTSCVNYCITTENSDFLFGTIYDRLSNELFAKEIFLESLEPFILEGMLTYITPDVMQNFIEHFKDKGELRSVEACIFHLDISSLDIHQVVSLCRSHRLYDTLFHIYNKGMNDYVTPLMELLECLNERMNKSTNERTIERKNERTNVGSKQMTHDEDELGNKILVYVSCCLSGRAYPVGEIPEDKVNLVREQVLLCITCLHGQTSQVDEPVYPYLRALIHFNTREFFNALSLAFQDSQLQSKEKQRVVDILLLLMIENVGFTPSQIGILFVFLGRQMSRKNGGITVKTVLFEQVLETLCTSDRSRHEEREQIVIDFLKTGVLERFLDDQKEESKLITMAESAGFHRAVEMLHVKRRRFGLALATYWKDPSREQKIFAFVRAILSNESVTTEEKESLKRDVVENLDHVVKIDAKRAARLMLEGLEAEMSEVLRRFEQDEKTLFCFLQGTFEHLDNKGEHKRTAKIDAAVYEKYVDLMCKFDVPQEIVIEFLKKNSSYRNDVILGISKHHSMKDVTCFLLEKSRDLAGAFALNLEILVVEMVANGRKAVESRISKVLDFLQRNSRSTTTEQTHKFWFELLDLVLEKQLELKQKSPPSCVEVDEDELTAEWMRQTSSQIVTTGMPYLPPGVILQKIISSPVYAAGRFSELRGLMTNMMETCNYEQVLMKTCAKMLDDELVDQMTLMKRSASRAISSSSSGPCSICSREMFLSSFDAKSEQNPVISFRCGHCHHLACILALSQQLQQHESDDQDGLRCHICHKSKLTFHKPILSSQSQKSSTHDVVLHEDDVTSNVMTKNFFRHHKTPSYMSILSGLNTSIAQPRHYKKNVFQSQEWLSKKLAAPPPQ